MEFALFIIERMVAVASIVPNDVKVISAERTINLLFITNDEDGVSLDFDVGHEVEVTSRDPKTVEMPDDAIGFYYFDTVRLQVEIGGVCYKLQCREFEHNGHYNESPYFFPRGRYVDYSDLPESIRSSNEKYKLKYDVCDQTKSGTFHGFKKSLEPVEVI